MNLAILGRGGAWRPASEIKGYHAHIYYDGGSKKNAADLRREIARGFAVTVGRWHDTAVGPHPVSMYQVVFAPEQFGDFVPWLSLNRRGLSILIHPSTGNGYEDHIDNAVWLGEAIELNTAVLGKNRPGAN